MAKQTLSVLPDLFTIHSLDVGASIPAEVQNAHMYFIGKTHEELSIVVPQDVPVQSDEHDPDWRVLEVLGPLQLSMVGIMAQIGNVLAQAKVSIFIVSTFETDFFLVKNSDLKTATQALKQDGYEVRT